MQINKGSVLLLLCLLKYAQLCLLSCFMELFPLVEGALLYLQKPT